MEAISCRGRTLWRHIREEERRHPGATGELTILLGQIAYAAKVLAHETRRAALVGALGLQGETNPSGEAQKKLDVFSNECAPLAFIVEQAGGRASTGTQSILAIRAAEIHQRLPLIIGSAGDVTLFEQLFQQRDA